MLVTEFARSTQGFAVEPVEEIVRLDWEPCLSAESSAAGGLVTSIARLDGDAEDTRLAQVLTSNKFCARLHRRQQRRRPETIGAKLKMKPRLWDHGRG